MMNGSAMGNELAAWSVTRRRAIAFPSAAFGSAQGTLLQHGLKSEHAERPFQACDVRDAARRVVRLARACGLSAQVVRGGLDLGGAELDHVWAIVDERVVDVALPVNAGDFVSALRAFVAGDLAEDELDRAANEHAFGARVVGQYPKALRYLGLPVFGSRPTNA
ncbi:MAG: hypothetical protein ACI867_001149 [Glaciecola sp.]|jgi:hypothetical protein